MAFVPVIHETDHTRVSRDVNQGVKYVDKTMKLSNSHSRAEMELSVLRNIKSPYIMSCRRFSLRDDELHMLLPEGVDITTHIRGPKFLSRLDKFAKEVTFGLYTLQLYGIVHRDVKLGNAVIQDGTFKLIDFELSTYVDANGTTASSFTCGTPNYQAPEIPTHDEMNSGTVSAIAKMKRKVSSSVDVWALGMCILKLIKMNFRSSSLLGDKSNRDRCGYDVVLENLLDIVDVTPPHWYRFMDACFVEDPSERSSYVDLLDILEIDANDRPSLIRQSMKIPVVCELKHRPREWKKLAKHFKNKRTPACFQLLFVDIWHQLQEKLQHLSSVQAATVCLYLMHCSCGIAHSKIDPYSSIFILENFTFDDLLHERLEIIRTLSGYLYRNLYYLRRYERPFNLTELMNSRNLYTSVVLGIDETD